VRTARLLRHAAVICISFMLQTPAWAWDKPAEPQLGAMSEDERNAQMEQAKALYANGKSLYDEGLYDQAVKAFEESYSLSGQPALLFNIANAFERLGDLGSALDALNWYRIYVMDEKEQERIARRINNMEDRLEEEKANAEAIASGTYTPGPRFHPAGGVLMGIGAAVGVGFGITAAATYGDSRSWIDEGDQTQYEDIRPLNNASLGLVGAGAGVFVVGVIVGAAVPYQPGTKVPEVAAAPTLDGGFAASATWRW